MGDEARAADLELEIVKRVAAIRLEADLHAYLDALASVGISEQEAVDLARKTLREAFGRVGERRGSAHRRHFSPS